MPGLADFPRNFGDPRAPYPAMQAKAAYFVETGAGTYNARLFLPGGALLTGIFLQAVAVWTAATSASAIIGDYDSAGVAIDADGFFAATDMKATDLLINQTLSLLGGGQGGLAGAYNAGTNTHWNFLQTLADRYIGCTITSVGAGTAGRTKFAITYLDPLTVTTVTV